MREYGASAWVQLAAASPPEFTPTCVSLNASWPEADRFWVAPRVPPASRVRACTRPLKPSKRCHATTALFEESTPTWGRTASWPGSDRVWIALTVPPEVRARACTRRLLPSERRHTTTALPEESTPTWGSAAPWPAADRVWVVFTALPPVLPRASPRRLLAPSQPRHTTTALPEPSTPTWEA